MASEDDVFHQIVRDALPGRVVSNFVLIAEIVDENSESLSLFMSDRMTPWLAQGMLKSASQMISESDYAHDDEED